MNDTIKSLGAVLLVLMSTTMLSVGQQKKQIKSDSIPPLIDDLYLKLSKSNNPSEFETLFSEVRELLRSNKDTLKTYLYIKQFAKLSQNCELPWRCVDAYLYVSYLYTDQTKNIKSIQILKKGVSLADKYGLFKRKGVLLLHIGYKYQNIYQSNQALENFFKALEVFKKIGDQTSLLIALYQISLQNYQDKDYSKAVEGFRKVVQAKDDKIYYRYLIDSWNALGLIYRNRNQLDSAHILTNKALEIATAKNDTIWVGILKGNIGSIYARQKDYKNAEKNFLPDIKISKRYKEWKNLAITLNQLADIYRAQNKNKLAKKYYDSTLAVCKRYNQYPQKKEAYWGLATLMKTTRNFEKANGYLLSFLEVNDSLQRRQEQNKLAKIEMTYQFRNQKNEIELLRKKNELQDAIIAEKNAWNFAIILVLTVVIFVLGVFYRNIRSKRKANQLLRAKQNEIIIQNQTLRLQSEEITSQRDAIEKKNEVLEQRTRQIESSIRAAFAIQNALLPHHRKLERLLKDYFLVYRPRDVVSGDFYWVKKIDKVVYLAVLDCTGHGVPGAFMSLIANTLLDKILMEKNKYVPSDILLQLHLEVRKALKPQQHGQDYGLDIGLLQIDKSDKMMYQVTYSGAKRSLYYIKPSDEQPSQILETKNDRFSIGANYVRTVSFTNQILELPKHTQLYLCTDGIADQNNKKRRTFTSNRLKELLLKNQHLPLGDQKKEIDKALDDYMIGTEQRDDMLLLGMKLS